MGQCTFIVSVERIKNGIAYGNLYFLDNKQKYEFSDSANLILKINQICNEWKLVPPVYQLRSTQKEGADSCFSKIKQKEGMSFSYLKKGNINWYVQIYCRENFSMQGSFQYVEGKRCCRVCFRSALELMNLMQCEVDKYDNYCRQ